MPRPAIDLGGGSGSPPLFGGGGRGKDPRAFFIASDPTFSFTPPGTGDYITSLTVTNARGASATVTQTVTIANVPPSVTIEGAPASSLVGTELDLTSQVNDPGPNDTFTYAWAVTHNGQPLTPSTPINAAALHFTPDGNGIWVVNLKVTDAAGGVGMSSTAVQVTGGVLTASIADAPTGTVLEGTPLTLIAELADLISPTRPHYEGSATKLGAHGGPAVPFACGTEATFTFTPDDDGTYTVNLMVIDTPGAAGTATPVASHVTNVRPSVNLDLTQPVTNAAISPGNLALTLADPLPGVARGPLPQRPRASASGTNTWRSAPPCGSFSRQRGPSQVSLEGER